MLQYNLLCCCVKQFEEENKIQELKRQTELIPATANTPDFLVFLETQKDGLHEQIQDSIKLLKASKSF